MTTSALLYRVQQKYFPCLVKAKKIALLLKEQQIHVYEEQSHEYVFSHTIEISATEDSNSDKNTCDCIKETVYYVKFRMIVRGVCINNEMGIFQNLQEAIQYADTLDIVEGSWLEIHQTIINEPFNTQAVWRKG